MINLDLWKKRKKALKLNYNEIAKRAGVSKRTIEDIFRGFTSSPRIDTVQAIERVLGISTDNDLMDTQKESITPLEMLMLDTFRQIGTVYGEQDQERAIEILKLAYKRIE